MEAVLWYAKANAILMGIAAIACVQRMLAGRRFHRIGAGELVGRERLLLMAAAVGAALLPWTSARTLVPPTAQICRLPP